MFHSCPCVCACVPVLAHVLNVEERTDVELCRYCAATRVHVCCSPMCTTLFKRLQLYNTVRFRAHLTCTN